MAITLVVEDGTSKEDANAYIDVTFCDNYHTDRGNSKWTAITDAEVKKACIVRATDYLEKRFGRKFKGTRRTRLQALQWPRHNASDASGWWVESDTIPLKVKMACAEYALRAYLHGELAPDAPLPVPEMNNATGSTPSTASTPGRIIVKREKVGPIEQETRYEDSASAIGAPPKSSLVAGYLIPDYPAADLLLEEYIDTSRTLARG